MGTILGGKMLYLYNPVQLYDEDVLEETNGPAE